MITHPLEPKSVTIETKRLFERLMRQGLIVQGSYHSVIERLVGKVTNFIPQDPQQVTLLDSWMKQKKAAEFCYNKIEECKILVAVVLFTDFKLTSPEELTHMSQTLDGFLQALQAEAGNPDPNIQRWTSQRQNYFYEIKQLFDKALIDKINRQLREQEKFWN